MVAVTDVNKEKIMKIKHTQVVDEFHMHEVLDRAHMVTEIFYTLLSEHPAISRDKEMKKAYKKAEKALANLYQVAAEARFKNY